MLRTSRCTHGPAELARLLLCSGLLVSAGASDLVWSRDANRERGGYESYDHPVERPVLPTPGEGLALGAGPSPAVASAAAASLEAQMARAQQVLGRAVTGPDGAVLGTVRGIARSKQDGAELQAIVAISGFLGLDKKHVLVPLEQLRLQPGAVEQAPVKTNIDQDSLEQMLEYRPDLFELVLPAARAG